MKHDFKDALQALYNPYDGLTDKQRHACEFALALAEKVTGEPSEGMIDAADIENEKWWPCADYDVIFEAMIQKAMEEVNESK